MASARLVSNSSISSAGHCLVPHLAALRVSGYCRVSAEFRKKHTIFSTIHDVFRLIQVLNVLLYIGLQAVFAYEIRSDMNNFIKVVDMLLCFSMSVPKQATFFLRPGRIDQLLSNLDDPYFNEDTEKSKSLLAETALSAKRLHRIYVGTAQLTCVLWLLFPVVEFVKGQNVQFAFWCGGVVHPDEKLRFLLVVSYYYYTTCSLGLANTTIGAFVGGILLQCCTQIKIVRSNLESLIEIANKETRESPENFESTTMRLLVRELIHYGKVSETYQLVQNLFGWTILVVFTIGAWCLCTTLYQLSTLNVQSFDFFSMSFFICCLLTELFVYCYFGNEVTLESGKLNESLYMMDWINAPRRVQRAMVIVMERAKRPIRPIAGGLVPLSLETFVGILRSSYSFYAMLRHTANNK